MLFKILILLYDLLLALIRQNDLVRILVLMEGGWSTKRLNFVVTRTFKLKIRYRSRAHESGEWPGIATRDALAMMLWNLLIFRLFLYNWDALVLIWKENTLIRFGHVKAHIRIPIIASSLTIGFQSFKLGIWLLIIIPLVFDFFRLFLCLGDAVLGILLRHLI